MLNLHFTDKAERHLEELSLWWAENRPDSRRQVIEEVERATMLLCEVPSIGSLHERKRGREIRRQRVGKTPYYLYYVVEQEAVSILAIWSAMRKEAPPL